MVLLAGSKFLGKEGQCWAAGVDLQDAALPYYFLLPLVAAQALGASQHLGVVSAPPKPPHLPLSFLLSLLCDGNIQTWKELICKLRESIGLKCGL